MNNGEIFFIRRAALQIVVNCNIIRRAALQITAKCVVIPRAALQIAENCNPDYSLFLWMVLEVRNLLAFLELTQHN